MSSLDNPDLKDQNIQINTDQPRTMAIGNSSDDPNDQTNKGIRDQAEERIGKNMVQSATEQFSKNWIEKYTCCLDCLKKYFEINSNDFYKRFLYSLIPFNSKFQDISENSPDLYGPFWIYTTLILVIASSGSLACFIQGNSTTNFFQKFVPIATGIIYSVGFGLPLIISLLMKCFGSKTSFVSVLCIYGYSFSIFIPIALICICPNQIVQWVSLGYGIFSSTSLLIVNYWKELGKYVDKKRYIIIAFVLVVQIGLYLLFKLYFFQQFSKEVSIDESPSTPSSTETTP